MFQFRLPDFEGPLDLLLSLIERQELDITRVSLAAVTDQYLDYISQPGAVQLSQLADYLIIAAKLILIKSRLLLPQPDSQAEEAEEDVGDALARQLREYKIFKQAAAFLRERELRGLRAYPRFAPPPRPQPATWKITGVTSDDLVRALQRALRIRPLLPQGTLTVPVSVSIEQQIHAIIRLTSQHGKVSFNRLLESATTRIEIIVTFLAVLELIKRQLILAQQEQLFGDIELIRRQEAAQPNGGDDNPDDGEPDYSTS